MCLEFKSGFVVSDCIVQTTQTGLVCVRVCPCVSLRVCIRWEEAWKWLNCTHVCGCGQHMGNIPRARGNKKYPSDTNKVNKRRSLSIHLRAFYRKSNVQVNITHFPFKVPIFLELRQEKRKEPDLLSWHVQLTPSSKGGLTGDVHVHVKSPCGPMCI